MSAATPSRLANRSLSTATPAAAGLAVLLASTALSGVVDGLRWTVFVAVAVAAVVGTGVLLRPITLPSGRPLPAPVIALGQLIALCCLLTAVFTRSGLLVLLPTPTSLQDLRHGLTTAMAQIEVGVPPIEATTEILLMITFGLGLVAIAVDIVAVTAAAPAAAGLVLLCVFAVPASVAESMLPWWTFVFGAGGFAALLAVDGQRRHLAWRGESNAPSDAGATPAATAVAGVALVAALLAGSALTVVGTIGRLPGSGSNGSGTGSAGLGLKPFTSLRGQLDRDSVLELFRVRGLDEPAYLRAMTLRKYSSGEGWVVDGLGGEPIDDNLPMPPDQFGDGKQLSIDIEALRPYSDVWLPTYGVPTSLRGIPGGYRYDPAAGTVFADRKRRPGQYTEQALFPDISADQLRAASNQDSVDPEYVRLDGVDPQVAELTQQITANANTRYDKALALYRYFTDGTNGFNYSLETRSGGSDDALVDFLFNGKAGYCEQYASSMAVMLRTIGIPSRVVLGFTAGYESGDSRVVTTQDAHAWVEAFFPGLGWTWFDPTPLADGRGITPSYVDTDDGAAGSGQDPDEGVPGSSPSPGPTTTEAPATEDAEAAPIAPGGGGGDWLRPLLATMLVLLVAGGLVAGPALTREFQRRSRLQAVAAGGPGAANAAWRELLAESWDRGTAARDTDTVRMAATRLAREHGLDDDGRRGLRTVVGAVERSWYGATAKAEPGLADALRQVRDSFTRNAPLALRARLLPRSVLRPHGPATDPDSG